MIIITLSEKEINDIPNNQDLGEHVRKKLDHERFINENSFDKCVICGKESPYTKNTHIDLRIGYVEGAGQGCFQPYVCDK